MQIPLNTEFRLAGHLVQVPVKDYARDIDRGEQVCQKTDHQCDCKAAYRAGPEQAQKQRGNDGRDVSIDDR